MRRGECASNCFVSLELRSLGVVVAIHMLEVNNA